ncbi:MAG: sugar ABC transporter substrate-binding protein [Lachnospiraceae bacterium]|nr:sugar ABC transporter substrate-binding protein [Lachnospiraceae bacterium]
MRKMYKMIGTAVITSAMLAASLSAVNVAADSSEKTKIRFATWDVADDIDAQQGLVDEFNAAHDDIEVTLEAYGRDFDTKISAGMGSGDAPDVMYMWNYPAYHLGLEPLDSYIEAEGADYKSDFYDALWNYNEIGDSIYGIPVGFTTHALYYNRDIFAEAGVDEPTADWTWNDLKEAAKTIYEKTGTKGFAFQMKPDPYDFEMYFWSNGTAYCDAEGKLADQINSEEAVNAVTMFQEMAQDGYAAATEGSGSDEFRSGNAAMFVYGSWAISSLDADGVNYGITKIPSFEGQDHSISILSSSGLSISKDSKNKEAAWEFVKFWTGADCNKARIGKELPVLNSVVASEGIMEQEHYAPFYEMLDQSAGYTPASFIMSDWSEVSEELELTFESVFNPSVYMNVEDALTEAADAQW